ncbi:MAG TPA: transcription antitermination factor NusB [Candidatus Aminicenantes bacterium]|nr:transcription antitermination factor NusB [Candidatus Aminicenantes bacterium]
MGQRRKARECALQILFQLEFNAGDPKDILKGYWERQKVPAQVRAYGSWIVETIAARGEEIDAAIQAASKNWRLARMAVVDRNILRIAVCELLHEPSLVPAIVMDEAIEIAKRYSGDESAVFVNGVLDAVVRRLGDGPDAAGAPEREGKHE